MKSLSPSATVTISNSYSFRANKTHSQTPCTNLRFPISQTHQNPSTFCLSCCNKCFSIKACAASTSTAPSASTSCHWMVLMETPPQGVISKQQVIEYYVKTLQRVLGNEKDAQMCIYDASWDTHFGFCCDVDDETSQKLARLPGVLSVKPDPDFGSVKKDYSFSNVQSASTLLFPLGNTKHWLVRMDKPEIGVVTKAQMVDYYAQILTKILGNEKDAQMCIYHVSWKSNFGFCCELDEESASNLASVPGVLSVQPDKSYDSENKDYGGNDIKTKDVSISAEASQTTPTRTKKLFVTGLSFYTSEKTLREAFEGFGQLVEVKIIMDKISKRSKGYAFIEYTTEEAAAAALNEMNGKIINGWMIVVDVAKTSPPRYSRGQSRSAATR
ncbi:organelle RRM domain-containing protein 1, chloroplastic [Rosa rugosa]|uniref:organelle RRM domain-containing protein 1, chloroplastic n=1 Tax=Rosa rugosa TaxID=74645 RepID=UPI002B416035|nr:organelle RRM domain-containing protein 1, chloroplastic [Rosa rugosa]